MTHNQSALTTLIGEVLADPDLAQSDVFRRMMQAGLHDLINGEALGIHAAWAGAIFGAINLHEVPETTRKDT